VSQAGRQRVLRERKKNVHAYLEGELVTVTGFAPYKGRIAYGNRQLREDWLNHSRSNTSWITYNPYKYECFVDQVRHQAYKGSKFAVMFPDRSCLAIDCKERLI
jgi:hypothetical protein